MQKLERSLIHTCRPGNEKYREDEIEEDEIEEDGEEVNILELEYSEGSNEVVKIFNQSCVICPERDSD